jgi:hypothetical protein
MLRKTWMLVVVVWALSGTASAQVAMLTQVSGEVRVAGKEGARAAVPFLKVNEGDKLTLGVNARVQMVYLNTGRQEIWKGSGQIDVGSTDGRSPSLKPDASQLPALVLKQLARTPPAGQQGKTGMVMVRSLDDLDAQDRLADEYKKFRASAAADDTTPEVFLLIGLLDLGAYDDARKVVDDLKAKQAAQPAFAAVVAHFAPMIPAAASAPRN